ncbi:MAG: hypothetical protein JOZ39_04025 [Chloroflexi bacterium]|nr:hypothetical protein [Chloroflexota bacterium]
MMQGRSVTLDASALLAFLRRESGWETVGHALEGSAVINSVNLAEVLTKDAEAGGVLAIS